MKQITQSEMERYFGSVDSYIAFEQVYMDRFTKELNLIIEEDENSNLNRQIFGQLVCTVSINNEKVYELKKQFVINLKNILQQQIDECKAHIEHAKLFT